MPWPDDLRRWSDLSSPRFVRFTDGGAVHVERTIEDAVGRVRSDIPFGSAIYARQAALCGRTGTPGHLFGIAEFEDGLLCRRCVHATPDDERVRLFEHDVPQEAPATH